MSGRFDAAAPQDQLAALTYLQYAQCSDPSLEDSGPLQTAWGQLRQLHPDRWDRLAADQHSLFESVMGSARGHVMDGPGTPLLADRWGSELARKLGFDGISRMVGAVGQALADKNIQVVSPSSESAVLQRLDELEAALFPEPASAVPVQDLPAPSVDEVMAQLETEPGLPDFKRQAQGLVDVARFEKLRRDHGLRAGTLHVGIDAQKGMNQAKMADFIGRLLHACGLAQGPGVVRIPANQLTMGNGAAILAEVAQSMRTRGGTVFIDGLDEIWGTGALDDLAPHLKDLLEAEPPEGAHATVILGGKGAKATEVVDASGHRLDDVARFRFTIGSPTPQRLADRFQKELCEPRGIICPPDTMKAVMAVMDTLAENGSERVDPNHDAFDAGRLLARAFSAWTRNQERRLMAKKAPSTLELATLKPEDVTTKGLFDGLPRRIGY